MDVWPPPPQRSEPQTTSGIKPPKTLVAVALGIPAGLLGGVAISYAVLYIVAAFDLYYPYSATHFDLAQSYLSFLAVPIEIGLAGAIFSKNKAFALAFVIAAVCVSMVLAVFCVQCAMLGI